MFTRCFLSKFSGRRIVVRPISDWTNKYLGVPFAERVKMIDFDLAPLFFDAKGVQDGRSNIDRLLSKSKGGFSTAMHLREDIMDIFKGAKANPSSPANNKAYLTSLYAVDDCVRQWLNNALCVDSLVLKRITFESSSGNILEKIARGESVHRVRSLNELKRRLHDGRCCYALFHHCLPEDPLVFVHIGLCSQIADSLQSLESKKHLTSPTSAMFYSINSPHAALSGLDLAAQLLKEVVPMLQVKYPSLTTFSTLSPIPNFMSWLGTKAKNVGDLVVPSKLIASLEKLKLKYPSTANSSSSSSEGDVSGLLQWLHATLTDENSWTRNEELLLGLKEPIMWLGCHYIACEKLKKGSEVLPLDPVARFHLRNGAMFLRLNWMGNPSTPGLQSSAGLMVNYKYDASLEVTAKRAVSFEKSQIVETGEEVNRILN